jgi:uncharacterized damage-inducible protein DinB
MTEPWLSGTNTDLPVVQRAVVHSLQMAEEDTRKWCGELSESELHARPFGLPSVAFQLKHIARSLDRFCTYAEGQALSAEQFAALNSELDSPGSVDSVFEELQSSILQTKSRLDQIIQRPLETPISIGRKGLPTTLAGLLVHAAEHTQRHVGQAVTTAKLLLAVRG